MKQAIEVAYAEGGNVTYYVADREAADDFVERVMESGQTALSAVVRPVNPSECIDTDESVLDAGDAQCDLILSFMKRNGSITALDAMQECACMRLASRIYDLRCRGYNIVSTMIKNNGKRYAQYRLKE